MKGVEISRGDSAVPASRVLVNVRAAEVSQTILRLAESGFIPIGLHWHVLDADDDADPPRPSAEDRYTIVAVPSGDRAREIEV